MLHGWSKLLSPYLIAITAIFIFSVSSRAMEVPEVIFPGSSDRPHLQRRLESRAQATEMTASSSQPGQPGQPRPKVPNIYVKKPHRKQPALGLFLAKSDREDEDWRLKSGVS